ncbi:hypothetical protein BC832DRAFT_623328 [Gaertneriomyces semiglobifer]|nr:hypothetical protein BC832DRAFT_623328 [Gaertneriomyces semiglobifer]
MPASLHEDDSATSMTDDIAESPVGSPAMATFGIPSPVAACPEYRPEEIHHIVETVDRYNPQNIPVLEAYVESQLQNDFYDRDACLAVLKLYQFNPVCSNNDVICNILSLALGALPDADFNLCLYMLNEDVMGDESIDQLVQLDRLLEQARFTEFWSVLSTTSLLTSSPHFARKIRDYISVTIAIAYQTISLARLSAYLNLEGKDLEQFVGSKGWTIAGDDVELPIGKENMVRPSVVQEEVKFEMLTKIVGYAGSTGIPHTVEGPSNMSESKSKLAALAAKRKAEAEEPASDGNDIAPKKGAAVTKKSGAKKVTRKEEEPPKKKSAKKARHEVEDEDEDDDSEDLSAEEEETIVKKKPTKKEVRKSKPAKKNKDSDDEVEPGSDDDEEDLGDDLDFLDTSNIISSGRRTRGKKIDYTQFGPDDADDDE